MNSRRLRYFGRAVEDLLAALVDNLHADNDIAVAHADLLDSSLRSSLGRIIPMKETSGCTSVPSGRPCATTVSTYRLVAALDHIPR